MQEKLNTIFEFLQRNKDLPKELRDYEYGKAMYNTNLYMPEKVIALMHFALHTQNQPKLDYLYRFFKDYDKMGKYSTMQGFVQSLVSIRPASKGQLLLDKEGAALPTYKNMYYALSAQSGWGPKTAALFTKIIFHLHTEYQDQGFWEDAPVTIEENDELFLPVDEAIMHIFKEIKDIKWDFDFINQEIKYHWQGADIALWDDLWFWGFLSQQTIAKKRVMQFNPAKLYTLIPFIGKGKGEGLLEEKCEEIIQLIKA